MKTIKIIGFVIVLASLFASTACNKAPSCSDGIQNQGELGIDCGGNNCPVCNCYNGILDGSETDVDCGGDYCPCCDPPCVDASTEEENCLLADTCSYQINNGQMDFAKPNSFILENGNLAILIDKPGNSDRIQITQDASRFKVGTYDVMRTQVTLVSVQTEGGKNYSSSVGDSAGSVTFTKFESTLGCQYVSGNFDVTVFNSNNDGSSLDLKGEFTEVKF